MTRPLRLLFRQGAAAVVALGAAGVPLPAIAQSADSVRLKQELADLREELRELEDTKSKIENDGHVLVVGETGPIAGTLGVLVERERVESLFVLGLLDGTLTDADVVQQASRMGQMTRIYVREILEPDLAALRRKVDVFETELTNRRMGVRASGGSTTNWPIPMDWKAVRGTVRGSYRVQCSYEGDPLPPAQGRFELEFTGTGTVRGTYEDEGTQWPVNGSIDASGQAAGGGIGPSSARYSWTARFQRWANDLVMSSHSLVVVPEHDDTTCNPGYMRQE